MQVSGAGKKDVFLNKLNFF